MAQRMICCLLSPTAVMTVSLPGCDPHLEWSLRYGNPEAVRFSAAAVVESFDYLLSGHINMAEATRRLRILRAAVRNSPAQARELANALHACADALEVEVMEVKP